MDSLIICRIAWSIATISGHGQWNNDVHDLQKYKDMGNSEFGSNTHYLECYIPYTDNKASEFPKLTMPS